MEFTCKENYETWKMLLKNEGIRSTAGRLKMLVGVLKIKEIYSNLIYCLKSKVDRKHMERTRATPVALNIIHSNGSSSQGGYCDF